MMAKKSVILKPEREKIYEAMVIVRHMYWHEGDKIRPAGQMGIRKPPDVEDLKRAVQNLRDVLNECTTIRFKGTF